MVIEGPLARLPRRAVMVRGETVASYLWRLAGLNGMTFEELARHIGAPRTVRAADPAVEEVRLGPLARQRLAEVSGHALPHLARALVSLEDNRISERARRQVEVEAWPEGRLPVQACVGCTAGVGERPVWRVPGGQWTVCTRHGRWTAVERGQFQLGLEALPEVVEAHVRRVRLERRTGLYARALLADAQQVAVYWWQCRQMAWRGVWRARQEALGVDRSALWAVPLVVYPEAVVVAEAMAVRERQRAVGRSFAGGPAGWSTGRWVEWVGGRLGLREEMADGGHRGLEAWLMAHRNTVPVVTRLAQSEERAVPRSVPLPPLEPHRTVPEYGPLEEVSCLPWRLGSPMTSMPWRPAGESGQVVGHGPASSFLT
ncbi:TniQ family protein [Streptomyces sp. NPDC088770]|uniref:TniQ family protein n=1 Tax=Streptomyces sp. NPDC088770 TaxID=3365895 RepID=UPI0037FF6E2A